MLNLKDLAKNILASHETRAQIIQEISKDTQKLIENFKNQREEMSKELKETLAKSQSLRKKDFNKMMEEILLARQKREEEVEDMLANFKKEQMEIAGRLRELLEKGESIKLADFKKTLVQIKKDLIEKDAKNSAGQIRAELAKMRDEIYGLVGNLTHSTSSGLEKEVEK